MPAWSPTDLTNPSFVKTQLSDKDRSNALFTTSNQLKSAETRAAEQEAAMLAAQEAQKNGPGRGEINALRAKSTDTTLTADERAQAAQQAESLADQRDKLNVAAANAQEKFNNTKQYVNDLTVGQSNLLAVGTVPPGTSLFGSPPGYEGRNSPAQDVPPSQNASATPTETTQELESASPALISDPAQARQQAILQENNASPQQFIDPNSDPNTSIGADVQPPVNQQTINPNSDPNTSIGADIQTIENAGPVYINDTYVTAQIEAAAAEGAANFAPNPNPTEQDIINAYGGMQGLQASVENARAQQITQDAENAKTQGDWRVRLSLAPSASYLYKAANPGILKYLQKTDGVIFPYVPQIQVTYAAHYDAAELTHSNYKIFQYKNSSIDQISITCDFTAQDNEEANYLLAVIHFFRSVTKMFYGQDDIPKAGTPPPLCYLSGLGGFQFDKHPLVISSFNYSLPNDVDYIRAGSPTLQPGIDSSAYNGSIGADATVGSIRLGRLNPGATQNAPQFTKATNTQPTYVPTKISISLVAYPIVTRNDISNNFSLQKYATGELLQGRKNAGGGGIW